MQIVSHLLAFFADAGKQAIIPFALVRLSIRLVIRSVFLHYQSEGSATQSFLFLPCIFHAILPVCSRRFSQSVFLLQDTHGMNQAPAALR